MWMILCLSTDCDIRSEIEKLELHNAFYRVKSVSAVDELLLAAVTETFDMFILDSSIHDEPVSDLCRAVRAADIDAVIVSLSEGEADRHKALDAGADLFVKLPNELKLLASKIDDLLDFAT